MSPHSPAIEAGMLSNTSGVDPSKPPKLPAELRIAVLKELFTFQKEVLTTSWLHKHALWAFTVLQVSREFRHEGGKILFAHAFSFNVDVDSNLLSWQRTHCISLRRRILQTPWYVALPLPTVHGELRTFSQALAITTLFSQHGHMLNSQGFFQEHKLNVTANYITFGQMLRRIQLLGTT